MASAQYDTEKVAVEVSDANRPIKTPSRSGIADPGPLGALAFAASAFVLSWYNVQIGGITKPNAAIGMAVGNGGIIQLLAGMWECPRGNSFSASIFTIFGAFWISYAIILTPGFGIAAAYGGDTPEFQHAIGIYLMVWFMIAFLFFIASLRQSVGVACIAFNLFMTLLFLAIGALVGSESVNIAGGVFGIITAIAGFYVSFSYILAAEDVPLFRIPIGPLSKRVY
ncbi:hypothetical protein AX15_004280 [Amanita polypyramis BW_CC]|nr:hypothetical protein AX15_004280 [Amanita polypyramis BW_CC]